jgi:predicted DNA-binding transcriptional regulator YafY
MQVGDLALAAAARAARSKIDAAWNGQGTAGVSARKLRSQQLPQRRSPRFTDTIRKGLRERRVLQFNYQDGDGKDSARQVQPLALTAFSAGWLLIAWCLLRRDFRVFRLDRISCLVAREETFEEQRGRDLATYLQVRAAAVIKQP